MRAARLTLALQTGTLRLPDTGRILVLGAEAADDLSALPQDRLTLVQGHRPDHDLLAARGLAVQPTLPEGPFAMALVCLPRSRGAARDRVAQAMARVAPGGPVVIDGQKTDGVDALYREVRARLPDVSPALSKAHGKLFVLSASSVPKYPTGDPGGVTPPGSGADAGTGLSGWIASPQTVGGGFATRPGVFSADGPDPGSALLAAALPAQIKGRGVDLGAGWGYLAHAVLARADVVSLDLVEADVDALACARANVTDPRAAFHWADATTWRPGRPAHFVICNPPFHVGRAADPALGAAFLRAAARMLVPDGVLWLVANRHLPYDPVLAPLFREVSDLPGTAAFRLTRAAKPFPPNRR
jgi:16S rRNA (guanine1207-N2)-methyltransferase